MLTLIIIVDQALACLYSFVSEFLTFGKEAKEEEDMQQRADKESSSETDVSCYTGSLDTQSPDGTQSVTISDTMPTATVFCWLCGPSQMTWTKGVQEAISSLPLAEEDCEVFKAMAVGKPKCHAIKGSDGGKKNKVGLSFSLSHKEQHAIEGPFLPARDIPAFDGVETVHPNSFEEKRLAARTAIKKLQCKSTFDYWNLVAHCSLIVFQLVVVVHNQNLHVLLISTATIEAGMEVTLPLSCRYRKRKPMILLIVFQHLVAVQHNLTIVRSPVRTNQFYQLLIVGGGSGGIGSASYFARKLGKGWVSVVEPGEVNKCFISAGSYVTVNFKRNVILEND
ncbi:hypothetical protein TTRE_0000717801 [Trichuris trichiura]|uniref:Uncharacterized protein n=1 Tax=Trichuris trichiura TaxID=36087 RepID=A0A077ZEP0_TRITR|nr:hypothetical protein TTRE_0000717801 [Trichuris trichiura]